MNARSLSLVLTGVALLLSAQPSFAAEKIIACMTLGTSNNGPALGVRMFQADDGSLRATVDQVQMFHNDVTEYDEQPLRNIEIHHSFSCGISVYTGEGFSFISKDIFLPTTPRVVIGQLRLDSEGQSVNGSAVVAEDRTGYCYQP